MKFGQSVSINVGAPGGTWCTFGINGKSYAFPELSKLCEVVFSVDIFPYKNELNLRLHGKDQFVHDM